MRFPIFFSWGKRASEWAHDRCYVTFGPLRLLLGRKVQKILRLFFFGYCTAKTHTHIHPTTSDVRIIHVHHSRYLYLLLYFLLLKTKFIYLFIYRFCLAMETRRPFFEEPQWPNAPDLQYSSSVHRINHPQSLIDRRSKEQRQSRRWSSRKCLQEPARGDNILLSIVLGVLLVALFCVVIYHHPCWCHVLKSRALHLQGW